MEKEKILSSESVVLINKGLDRAIKRGVIDGYQFLGFEDRFSEDCAIFKYRLNKRHSFYDASYYYDAFGKLVEGKSRIDLIKGRIDFEF